MGLSFRRNSEGIRLNYQSIRWDYHLEEITEVLCGTIKWTYHYEVKDRVSGGTIWWGYLLEVKQKYQVELSGRSTIWKQWQRY